MENDSHKEVVDDTNERTINHKEVVDDANELSYCPGTQSVDAGISDACVGCPNQEACASAPKGPDPEGKPEVKHKHKRKHHKHDRRVVKHKNKI